MSFVVCALIGFTCGLSLVLIGVCNLSIGIRAMTTQKERIEKLETDIHEIKESIQRLEQSIKETIAAALKEAVTFASTETKAEPPHRERETMASHSPPRHRHAPHHREDGHSYQPIKMEFPQFHGDDPIVWLDRATQFFEYQ
jgi:hypothetical protein